MTIKILSTAILLILSMLTFAQVDTINYRPHVLTKTETTVKTNMNRDGKYIKSKTKKKKTEHLVDDKKVTQKQYNRATKESNTLSDCKPCWLKYYDIDGVLYQEGLSYEDCALGKRTEYYPSGKVKVIRFFQTNETLDWTNFPCSVATGTWAYYKEDGTIEKTEKYEEGKKVNDLRKPTHD